MNLRIKFNVKRINQWKTLTINSVGGEIALTNCQLGKERQ